ncbi:MAG: YncE family protein [Thermoplasmata archaeon]|nr:YncE family protein [Thermoplasmata archaeon]
MEIGPGGWATRRGDRWTALGHGFGIVLLILALILGAQTTSFGLPPSTNAPTLLHPNSGTRALPTTRSPSPTSTARPRDPIRELADNQSIPVGQGPIGAAFDPDNGYVYVANSGPSDNRSTNGSVSVINGSSVIGAINVGGYPTGVSFDPFNGLIYVSYVISGTGATGAVQVVSGFSSVATVGTGYDPLAAVVDLATGKAYVVNTGSDNVTVINGTAVASTIPVGVQPAEAVFDPASGYVYVPNSNVSLAGWCDGNISVLNGTSSVSSIPDPYCPASAAYDPVDEDVYVANWAGGNVSVINSTSVSISIRVGGSPNISAVDLITGDVFVSNPSNLSVIQGTSVVATLATGGYSAVGGAAFDTTNGDVYLPVPWSNNVTVLNGTAAPQAIPVGGDPVDATFDADNSLVYVTNFGADSVSLLGEASADPDIASFTAQPAEVSVGSPTSFDVDVAGGNGEWSYTYSGLPSGCFTDDSSDLGCTPTTSGLYSIRVTVNDSEGDTATATTALTVAPFVITQFTADPATVRTGANTTFDVNVSATGVGPLTYRYAGLPGGCLAVNRSTFTCTPAEPGTFNVSVFVNDSGGNGATDSTELTVSNSSSPPDTVPLTFVAVGLPFGTTWAVTVDGSRWSSDLGAQTREVPNGTYSFSVGEIGGYQATPSSGNVSIAGVEAHRTIDFRGSLDGIYSMNFTEAGLSPGTGWSVLVNGTLRSTTGSTVTFSESNGTFEFEIPTLAGYEPVPSGTAEVNGTNVTIPVAFSEPTFLAVFFEFGLPVGANWSLTVWNLSIGFNETQSSTTNTISFLLPNGTFRMSASFPAGFNGALAPGSVTVAGTPSGVPTILPVSEKAAITLPPVTRPVPLYDTWPLAGGLALVLAAGALAMGYRMGRQAQRRPGSHRSAQ